MGKRIAKNFFKSFNVNPMSMFGDYKSYKKYAPQE